METSLKAMRKLSHDILSYASILHPVYTIENTLYTLPRNLHLDIWSLNKIIQVIKEQNWKWQISEIRRTLYKNFEFGYR